jgi:DNA polymerase-3 subunit gamma/tau
MRDAESTLDQLISFCGDKIEEADVLSMFGLAAESQILNLSKAVLAGDVQTALTELNQLAQGGKDLGRLLSDLLSHFRNLLIFQISRGDLNLLEVSENEVASLKEQSASANSDALMRILDTFTEAELHLRDAASKKIFLEVALLKAIEARNAVSIDAVLKQLNHLRGGSGGGSLPASAPAHSTVSEARPAPRTASPPKENFQAAPAPTSAPATPPQQTASQAAPASTDLATMWASLVESVGRVSPFVRTYLLEAHPVSFEKNLFIIGFDPEFSDHLGLVDNSRNQTMLQTKLAELGHPSSHVKFIQHERPAGYVAAVAPALTTAAPPVIAAPASAAQGAAPAATPARTLPSKPAPFNKSDFKNDPLIQKALEIFKGQIVEVRA